MRDCAREAEVERRTDGENRVRSPPREAIAPGRRRTPPGIAVRRSLAQVTVSHDLSYRNPLFWYAGASCTPRFPVRRRRTSPRQDHGPRPTAAAASRPGRAGAIRWHAVGARRRGRAAWVGRCHKSWHREQLRGVVLLRARPMLAAGSLEGSTMPGDDHVTTGCPCLDQPGRGALPPAVTRRRSVLCFLCLMVQSDL